MSHTMVKRLMLFREIVAVYSENRKRRVNKQRGRMNRIYIKVELYTVIRVLRSRKCGLLSMKAERRVRLFELKMPSRSLDLREIN
jgi:hypothetical protein